MHKYNPFYYFVNRKLPDIDIDKTIKAKKAKSYLLADFIDDLHYCYLRDNPKSKLISHIDYFLKHGINSNLFEPNEQITLNFQYVYHFFDTWEKHNVTLRLNNKSAIRIQGGNLLHLAAILGNNKMAITLIENGTQIIKDQNGNEPKDLLFFNENYMTKKEFSIISNILSGKSTVINFPKLNLV